MTKRLPVFLVLLPILAFPVFATTVKKLTFEQLVNTSELIIEGEVESVMLIDSGSLVHSRVLIRVDNVLKGENPGEFVELDFLGGEGETVSVAVAGQDIPDAGEKGFYFIESVTSKSVNPLTGWSQGHFRVLSDLKGNEYLDNEIRQDVIELTNNKEAILAAKLRNMRFSSALVNKLDFKPATPQQLRDAVARFLTD